MKNAPTSAQTCTRDGMALFGVLMILASLSLIAGTVYTVVQTNTQVTGHHKNQQESFFQADAAIHYVQTRLGQDILSGSVNLDQSSVALNYVAPSGYTFDTVTNLTRLANTNHFLIEVTGRSRGASTTIEAILGRKNAMGKIGVFGDEDLRVQPGFDVYSYNSDDNLDPLPSDSTGAAGAGSNIQVTLQPGMTVDGTIFLGQSVDGIQALLYGGGTTPVEEINRVTPDPLGAVGGPLALSFAHYSSDLNNDNLAAGISGNVINVNANKTFTLYSGYYYLDSVTVGSQALLQIESTPDEPVVIFLTGDFRTQPNTDLYSTSKSPRALYILSNGSGELQIQPNGEFRGFVYAPYANLDIQPNGLAHGVFWGRTVTLQPQGNLYVDNRLLDDFVSGTMEVVQWKEVR